MAATHCLALIRPYDPETDARVDVRLASANLREITGLGTDGPWEPAMSRAPTLAIQLFNGDFTAAVTVGTANLPISMPRLIEAPQHAGAGRYAWSGAEVELRLGKVGDAWPWPVRFRGRVSNFEGGERTLTLTASTDTDTFAAEVLHLTYAGTGDAEGTEDLAERVKPLAIGNPMNVEPVLINAVDSVYQFSGYGPIEAVQALFERGSDFGPPLADHATYDALVAATIPPGNWATCLAEGMIRLGAPAAGVITGDILGHVVGSATPRQTGTVIKALANIAGIADSYLELDSLAALNADAPFTIDLFLDSPIEFADAARGLALPCNYQAGITPIETFFVAKVDLGRTPDLTLDAQGRALPQVADSREENVSTPYAKTTFGAARAWRVHTSDEIAFDAPLVPRGAYDPAEIYRYGNIVTLPDQSEWLYINDTPAAGNAPPAWPTTSNAWWENMAPPVSAEDISYGDGTPLEDLKPLDPNATHGAPPGTPVGDRPAEEVISAIEAAKARADALENETIPAIDGAVAAANARITVAHDAADAAHARAEAALGQIGTLDTDLRVEITRVEQTGISTTDAIGQRIDAIVAEGGGGSEGVDSVARAEVQRVEQASVSRDNALGTRVDEVTASIGPAINAKATEITTAFTEADLALAERTSLLETTGGSSSVARNPAFSAWPAGQLYPAAWQQWAAMFSVGRGDGDNVHSSGPTLILHSVGAEDSGIRQTIKVTPGPAIVELALGLDAGNFIGAGIILSSFNEDGAFLGSAIWALDEVADVSGNINFAGGFQTVPGRVFRYSLFANLIGTHSVDLYYVNNGGGFGFSDKVVRLNYFGLRPASAPEAEAQAALPALAARVGTVETATTDGRFATAQRAEEIATYAGGLSGRISTVETATTDGRFATTSRVQTLESDLGGTQATLTEQAGTITGLQQRTAAYWQVVAVAGDNRAAIRVSADVNGGAGVEIVGDLRVSGQLILPETVALPALDRSTMTASTQVSVVGGFQAPFVPGVYPVPGMTADMAIGSGGSLYFTISGDQFGSTNGGVRAAYISVQLLDTADNILADLRVPSGLAADQGALFNYVIRAINLWGARTIRWRLVNRNADTGTNQASTNISNPTVQLYWTAL